MPRSTFRRRKTILARNLSLPSSSAAASAGSRPSDNFGFARWGTEHAEELIAGLGEGRHYGEWWGPGIQRRYGVKEKTFSLFNTKRWGEDRPACCSVVPVLYEGLFTEWAVNDVLVKLKDEGSLASPGFMRPEGIVIWHTASRTLFKKTIENDEVPKGAQK
jgi:hypothetical protein